MEHHQSEAKEHCTDCKELRDKLSEMGVDQQRRAEETKRKIKENDKQLHDYRLQIGKIHIQMHLIR